MALPIELSPVKLRALSEKELYQYFTRNARYMARLPHAYAIQFGSRSLKSNDTLDLWKKFKKAVKS